jgi:hypothetical protein
MYRLNSINKKPQFQPHMWNSKKYVNPFLTFYKFIHITNLMGHNLAIIVVWNLFFIGLYGINIDVIHLLVLFEHWYCAHCLDTNVICLFVFFKQGCCMVICVVLHMTIMFK